MKDDLISRQAAIDALRFAQHRFTVADEAGGMGTVKWSEDVIYFAAAERVLSELPSAQPEIIRCKDCRHRIVNDHYGEKGYLKIKGYCELDTGDPFELGRDAQNDDWFCADAERRTG